MRGSHRRSRDPHHVMQVGVGGEGFFGAGDPLVTANPEFPNQTWPQRTGQVCI